MSTTIVSRIIGGNTEKAAQMLSSNWARPVALPVGWQTIRLGVRFHLTNTGANLTGNPIFAMGFNSGTTNLYGDTTTQNFIGFALDNATWFWSAPGSSYQVGINQSNAFYRTRIGTTNNSSLAYGDGSATLVNAGASSNLADREILFVDITKGSPNYSVHLPFRCVPGPGQGADVSATNFLLYMGQTTPTPTEGGYNTGTINTGSLAFSEISNGTLDCINFYWNRPDALVEICDVAVAIIA